MKSHCFFLSALLFAGCATSLYADDSLQTLHGNCTISASQEAERVEFRLQHGSCEDGRRNCNTSDSATPLSAFSGFGWTSTMMPSAPAAIAARAMAATSGVCPVPWLGSMTTGRCVLA